MITIVHYRYILTACHCTNGYTPTTLGARVGEDDTLSLTETKYTAEYPIAEIIRHDYYNTATQENDIALLRLSYDITWKRGVGPACLPFKYSSTSFVGTYVQVPGWGSISFGGPTQSKLRKASLQIVTSSTCSSLWSPPKTIPISQSCVKNPPQDTCSYDSGGSLYFRPSKLYTLGFISFGAGCGTTTPTVCTNIFSFLNWISSKTPGITFANV